MRLLKQRYQTWLVPYAEGTLEPRKRARLEARLERDSRLAAEADAQRRIVARLREAAQAQKRAETAPAQPPLWPALEPRLTPRQPLVRPLIIAGSACAAAVSIAGFLLWAALGHVAAPNPPVPPASSLESGIAAAPAVGAPRIPHRHRSAGPPLRRVAKRAGKRPALDRSVRRFKEAPVEAVNPENDAAAANETDPSAPNPVEESPAIAKLSAEGAHFQAAVQIRPLGGAGIKSSVGGGDRRESSPEHDAQGANRDGLPGADGGTAASPAQARPAEFGTGRSAETGRRHKRRLHRRHHARRRNSAPLPPPGERASAEGEGDRSWAGAAGSDMDGLRPLWFRTPPID
jgi:anti-sigma factor RsiW